MELEVIRAIAAAAADDTIGVNAMLAGVPLDGDDVRPANVTIYNSVDTGAIARRAIPAEGSGLTFPVLAIYVADAAALEQVRSTVRDGHFPVAMAYLDLESDSAKGNRDACYVMRAALRFLTRFASPANQAMRTRGDVILISPNDFKQSPVFEKWDAGIVQATLVTQWLVRETAA